jgi:hypothetical protein
MNKLYTIIKTLLLTYGFCIAFVAQSHAQVVIPKQAEAVGYNVLTFSSTLRRHDIDLDQTARTGFQWYLWNFFGKTASPAELEFGADGVLTLYGRKTGNSEIATAVSASNDRGFFGMAFGGGAYIEATLKFDPKSVERANYKGHPSFWSMSLEHLVGNHTHRQNSRADKFERFIEADFFEYDIFRFLHIENVYGGALHDWYGIYNRTCPKGFCKITTPSIKKWIPPGTDLRCYHTYGFLWVPATPVKPGYAQYYFDNKPIGERVEWQKYGGQLDPTNDKRSAFSIIDQQHLVLILGTGVNEPMTVRSVRVYQSSRAFNLKN